MFGTIYELKAIRKALFFTVITNLLVIKLTKH